MSRRWLQVGATMLWLALPSCRPPADVTPTTVVQKQPTERWLDLDIVDDGHHGMGCAVDNLGALWCWGEDPTLQARLRPQLGPAEQRDRQRSGPTRVEGVVDARAVTVSKNNVCRVDVSGRVYCVRHDETNWQAIDGVEAAEQIMVSELGGCAVESDRTLRCWSGSRSARAVAQDVIDVTMDDFMSCALRTDGEVSCWDEDAPPTSHGRVANAVDIALESHISLLVLDAEGRVMVDELRDGKAKWVERSRLPDAVEFDVSRYGPDHNQCGRTAEGTVHCRGRNVVGQLGGGHSNDTDELVTLALSADQRAREVAVAENRTCVRTAEEILCVGADVSAWDPPADTVYQHVVELEVVSLAAHRGTTCVIDRAGDLRCWGGDAERHPLLGIQGVATPTTRAHGYTSLLGIHTSLEAPDVLYWIADGRLGAASIGHPNDADKFVAPAPHPEILAFASDEYACMIEASARGRVATCGENVEGHRMRIAGLQDPTAMATLRAEFCAIDRSGRVLCTQLSPDGDGEPASVIAGVQDARSIAATEQSHRVDMCAALESGQVMCWVADRLDSTPATDVGLTDVVSLVGTHSWFCSLDRTGAVACWIPDGDHVEPIPGPTIDAEVVQLAAGSSHACALDRAGTVTCWGSERYAQLGRLPAAVSLQPTALVFGP